MSEETKVENTPVAQKAPAVKKISKVSKVRSRLAQGWKDVEKIAADTGAAVGTVKVQMYKYFKENNIPTPRAAKKAAETKTE